MSIETKGVRWYSGRDCIGIVLVYDTITNEEKAYIGVGKGYNETDDIQTIKDWGAKFDVNVAKLIIG